MQHQFTFKDFRKEFHFINGDTGVIKTIAWYCSNCGWVDCENDVEQLNSPCKQSLNQTK
jgi:hypothetical protein